MDNGRYSLIDMLDHQPDLLADSKIKAMMSDIYNNIVSYIDNGNNEQVSELINSGGVHNFIKWFIENVYSKNVSDVKVISYINENMDDILDVLSQAVSNLTPKEVIDNMKEEKVDGAEEVAEENGTEEAAVEEIKEELKDESESENSNDQQTAITVPEPETEPKAEAEPEETPETEPSEQEETKAEPPSEEEPEEETEESPKEMSERDKAFAFIDSMTKR